MALQLPKRTKYRKTQRGKRRGLSTRGTKISFGEYGLLSLGNAWISNRQIEAARVALARHIQQGGRVWICIFPDKPVTKKPMETRMGKGKGAPELWVAVVKRGRVLLEIEGIPEDLARDAMRVAAAKFCVKTKFISRRTQR